MWSTKSARGSCHETYAEQSMFQWSEIWFGSLELPKFPKEEMRNISKNYCLRKSLVTPAFLYQPQPLQMLKDNYEVSAFQVSKLCCFFVSTCWTKSFICCAFWRFWTHQKYSKRPVRCYFATKYEEKEHWINNIIWTYNKFVIKFQNVQMPETFG